MIIKGMHELFLELVYLSGRPLAAEGPHLGSRDAPDKLFFVQGSVQVVHICSASIMQGAQIPKSLKLLEFGQSAVCAGFSGVEVQVR